jgi:hypothetical protein
MRLTCAIVVAIAFTGALTGCLDRDLKPLNPCTQSGVVERVRVTNVDKVDLLFMVDNSNSMTEEQASLTEQFPRLVTVLATGDRNPTVDADGDGNPANVGDDFPPVMSLQIGVITSDMGVGGFNVMTCNDEPNFGDNGLLRTQGNTAISGCMATYPSFLEFRRGATDAAMYARDVSCVATVGTGGCGFEQQLEAVLKAVTPSTCTDPWCTFNMGTRGHADVANSGFVRPDSLLALILVTDEEDCSVADSELFNTASTRYSGELNLRCFLNPTAQHPISRFVEGYLATRNSPDLLVYAAITGVPPNVSTATATHDQILALPEMQEEIDPTMMTRLRPSCNVAGRGIAFPPRRIVEVAKGLETRGSNGLVYSICQADFTPALDGIIEKIADVLGGTCLPRALNPDDMGLVDCDVIEVLPTEGEFTTCDSIPGRTFVTTETDAAGTHDVCRVTQLPFTGGSAPIDPGWYYDTSDEVRMRCPDTPQRITFTSGNEPRTGTLVRLECLQPVQASMGPSFLDIDSPCTPGTDSVCPAGGTLGDKQCPRDYELSCDMITRTWERTCSSDANCAAGWRCDVGRTTGGPICRNPTCG